MKNYITYLFIIFSFVSYSQNKIAFFDKQKKPINDFQLTFLKKDSLYIYKSNNRNNIYDFEYSALNQVDSIFITFNSFYSSKIRLKDFIEKDSIFLKKEIPLNEVVITKKYDRKELGIVSKNKSIIKIGNSSRAENIIGLDVSDKVGYYIESINLYIFEKFRDLYNKKHKNKNLNIKFFIFQSDSNPNENIVNLLENELIVNTEQGNKGWMTIDLKKMKIKIKDLKYLYIGFSTFGKPIAIGGVKRKRILSENNFTSYSRSSDTILKRRKWRKKHYKTYVPKSELYELAIKIDIKK